MTTRPLLAVLVLASGCVSLSSAQRADTLGAGGLQVAVEPTVQVSRVTAGISLGGVGPQSLQGAGFVHPAADAAIRYGVHERVDVGLRLGTSGLEAHTKVRLTDGGRFIVSLAPTLGGGVETATLAVPLLLGIRLGAHELTFGFRPMALVSTRTGAVDVAGSASVGVALQVTEFFALMPEVAAGVPFVRLWETASRPPGMLMMPLVQFRLGVHFGPFPPAARRTTGG